MVSEIQANAAIPLPPQSERKHSSGSFALRNGCWRFADADLPSAVASPATDPMGPPLLHAR